MSSTTGNLLLLFSVLFTITTANHHHYNRHLLHQPFFPQTTTIPPIQPPSLSPQSQPKYPFSSIPNKPQKPFFPTLPSPPPPPTATPTLATFPANISSILFPHHSSSSHRTLVLTVSISLSVLFVAVLASLSAFFIYSRRSQQYDAATSYKAPLSDSLRFSPSNAVPSDGCPPKPPKIPPRPGVPNTSSEFLYLGTLVNSRNGIDDTGKVATLRNTGVRFGVQSPPYQKLGSPELRPLPPLPRHNYTPSYRSGEVLLRPNGNNGADTDTEEEFFSPRESSARKDPQEQSALHVESSSRRDNFGSRSFNSRTASYPYSNSYSPANSVSSTSSPGSNPSSSSKKSKSSDTIVTFPAPVQCLKRPTPSLTPSSSRGDSSGTVLSSPEQNLHSLERNKQPLARMEAVSPHFLQINLPPPAPPLPPPRFWEMPVETRMVQEENLGPGNSRPPVLVAPSGPVLVQSHAIPVLANEQSILNGSMEKSEETTKPKLKPLHWDKVRASSNRAMVWDQLQSSSFQLNEEMIETLFMVNNSNANAMDNNARRQSLPLLNRENRVLDPKKSQNIAILLRALNVTIDEVCEALWEGNSDNLGTELLESLLKMAPTKVEEQKLKEFKDESPFKLGPAEKFLKAVLDIPFAFKRIDAMLYISNFDSEIEYLRRSMEILQAACEELRNSRIFLRLLEAVLKTGNRMNVGTNRGDAQAFKLDTLLKLVDVKGTDGKTTLLHFVVQEIIRSEGSRLSGGYQNQGEDKIHQTTTQDDVEFRKLGLQVVSGLSGELNNVKKAAAMESDVLTGEVAKLASGITKIHQVLKLNNEISLKEISWKFSESMDMFQKKAEEEIARIQAQEKVAHSIVKETTEYFHGNSAKEEARPFRIFMVVRDFLSILDHVCREVGKINERTIYSSVRPMPLNPSLGPVFPGLGGRQNAVSSDVES